MLKFKESKITTLIFILISIVLLVTIGLNIKRNNSPILFDEGIMEYIHKSITEFGEVFMGLVTNLGSVLPVTIMTIVISLYFIKKKDYNKLIFILLASLGTSGLNQLLKHFFVRTRPEMYFLIKETGYSFPSGHSMVSMAFYTSIFYLLSERYREYKGVFLALNFILVSLIGISRIYLGVHWPTDVLVGYFLGYTWFRTIRHIYKYLESKKIF